uniref:DUF2187 domain-containing protein n=1 Tax=Rhizobium phage LG08 TaxID=3129229 RepID=A0AAU8HYJ8_9CAUD
MKTRIKFEYEGTIVGTIMSDILPPIGTRVSIQDQTFIVERYNLIVKEFGDSEYEVEVKKAWSVHG